MSGTGYDLNTSIYSQDGKIYQLEYSQKAILAGETMVGLVCKNGVILATEKIRASRLQAKSSDRRIFSVDDHIGIGICGRIPDGKVIVSRARVEAENY